MRMLLVAGADPNLYNHIGHAPLFSAAISGQPEIVYALVQAGAHELVRPNPERTYDPLTDGRISTTFTRCLHMAVERADAAGVNSFLALGFSALTPDEYGATLMHQVVGPYNPAEPTQLDVIARVILRSVGIRATQVRDAAGRTPLHLAVLNGNMRVAACLLLHGADVNAQDSNGNTPLHLIGDSRRMRDLLLTHGADLSIANHARENPVYFNINNWVYWLDRIVVTR